MGKAKHGISGKGGKYHAAVLAVLMISALASSCSQDKVPDRAAGYFEVVEVTVSSEGTGRIVAMDIEEGQLLTAGEEAGRIDSVQLELKKRQLLASIRAVDSRRADLAVQISVLEEQITAAEKERRRVEKLLESDAATRKQLDDINSQINLLERQADAQRSTLNSSNMAISGEVESLEMQVRQVEDQIKKCIITSPVEGTVLARYMEKGEFAQAGKPLFTVADISEMYLRAYITADILTSIKTGGKVKVSADFGRDGFRDYEGKVTWISQKAEFTPKTIRTRDERANLVYAVKISVMNDGYIKSGMYGEASFEQQ